MKTIAQVTQIFFLSAVLFLVAGCDKPADHAASAPHPDDAHLMQELYANKEPVLKVQLDDTHVATPWFGQQVNDGVSDLYVLFAKVLEQNEGEGPVGCHACTASIDVITYARTNDGWTKESAIKGFTEMGAWGDVPAITSAKVLNLSPGHIALAIPGGYTAQGETEEWETLLAHQQGRWADIGFLTLGSDNSGALCAEKGKKTVIDGQPVDRECYSYTSTYALKPEAGKPYPDIIVTRSGTVPSPDTDKAEAAGPVVYTYNGTRYLSPEQAREEAQRQAQEAKPR